MEKFSFIQDLTADSQTIPSDSILSRTLLQNEYLRVILFQFAAGQELSEHTASKPAVLHFISGEAAVTLGEEHKQARANTYVYMEPHLPHSILAKTDVIMLLMILESK
jgi:quercetin dioxygenase-like cupin family protein